MSKKLTLVSISLLVICICVCISVASAQTWENAPEFNLSTENIKWQLAPDQPEPKQGDMVWVVPVSDTGQQLTPPNNNWIYGVLAVSVGLFVVAGLLFAKVKGVKVNRKAGLALATVCLLSVSMLSAFPVASADQTAKTGYKLSTPQGPDYYVCNYTDGSLGVIRGSDWANLITYMGTAGGVPVTPIWAGYSTNASAVWENIFNTISYGVVKAKEVAPANTAGGLTAWQTDIPDKVQVDVSYQGNDYSFANPLNSAGSPYTVSVGAKVTAGFYTAEDSQGRILWSSLDCADVVISAKNALTAGRTDKETIVIEGDCIFTKRVEFGAADAYTKIVVNGKITAASGINGYLFLDNSGLGDHIEITGSGLLDGNMVSGMTALVCFNAGNEGCSVHGLTFNNSATYHILIKSGANGTRVYDNTFLASKSTQINQESTASSCVFENNLFMPYRNQTSKGTASLTLYGDNNVVSNNIFRQMETLPTTLPTPSSYETAPYYMFYGPKTYGNNITITGNTVINYYHVGILVSGNYSTVTGNTAIRNGEPGICVFGFTPGDLGATGYYPTGNTVIGNTVNANGIIWTSEAAREPVTGGIRLNNCSLTTVIGNTLRGNDLRGVYIENGTDVECSGNIISGSGTAINATNSYRLNIDLVSNIMNCTAKFERYGTVTTYSNTFNMTNSTAATFAITTELCGEVNLLHIEFDQTTWAISNFKYTYTETAGVLTVTVSGTGLPASMRCWGTIETRQQSL